MIISGRSLIWENAIPVTIILILAFLSAELSFRLRADTVDLWFNAELKTLNGYAYIPEFQNRILSPALLTLIRKLLPAAIANKSCWYLLRFLEASTSYLAIYISALGLVGSRLRALVVVFLATYAYVWTPMSNRFEVSSDFFDMGFTALFVWLALRERPLLLLLAVFFAATNRESAAFAGIIWMAVAGLRYGVGWRNWPRLAWGPVYIVAAALVTFGLRYGLSEDFRPQQQVGILDVIQHGAANFHPTGWLVMLAAMTFAFVFVFSWLPRPWSVEQKALLIAAIACAAISTIFGIASELRVYLPCFTIMSFVAVVGSSRQSDREWVTYFLDTAFPAMDGQKISNVRTRP